MKIQPLYEEFLTYLAVERNSAKLTVEAYRSDSNMFFRFLDEQAIPHDVDAITKQVLRQYVVWLRDRGLQPATVARRIHSLRSFWNYLWDSEYTDNNPFRRLALPRNSRKLPTYLSEDDCRRLLDAAGQQTSPFFASRDTALLTFMLFTGARRGEVLNLTWQNLDLDVGTARFVDAKGGKTRVVPLADVAVSALAQWRAVRNACGHDYVFTAQSGVRLGKRGLTTALARAVQEAGIDSVGVTPHKLRHSFACMLVRNGADLSCLQRMLGHTRLDTTGVYLQATAEDLKEAMKRHPLGDIPLKHSSRVSPDTKAASPDPVQLMV